MTEDVEALIRELQAAGVRLWVEGESLRASAPSGAITPVLRSRIQAAKAELIRLLQQAQPAARSEAAKVELLPEPLLPSPTCPVIRRTAPPGGRYLKPIAVIEPLYQRWYAWPNLIAPATAAMIVTNQYLPLFQSFVSSPLPPVSSR